MIRSITCTINSKPITWQVDVRMSLADVLRTNGFTSVKEGCGVGECGACAVLVDGLVVDSCIYLAIWADGCAIRTVEGEAQGDRLSEVQQAYLDTGSVQCGFCTPGLVMTSTRFVETHKGKNVSRDQIRREHGGHICRCTGYESIIRAVELCLKPDDRSK